jgi:hypothetical protein
METKEIIFVTGVIVGAILLIGVLYSFIKNNKVGSGGYWIIIAGIILFGLSIWNKFSVTPEGITFETYDQLKRNYNITVEEVNKIKKEKDNISKQLDNLETKLKSNVQINNKENLLKSLDSIKVSTRNINLNIDEIDQTKKIMTKEFEEIDKKEFKDRIEK